MGGASFAITLLLVGFVVLDTKLRGIEAQGTNVLSGNGYYLDRFNYDETVRRRDGFTDYGPKDWEDIECDEQSSLKSCLAYRDKWETGRHWDIEKNYCRWCPEDNPDQCGEKHHQSPIDLKRATGFEPFTHEFANECIDIHWMKYEDSFCSMEELIEADAFSIERHALRISQPIAVYDNLYEDLDGLLDGVRLLCRRVGNGSRFGRIDFSKGFSQWWHLSHTDIHTPSEHTQDGVRYDAEIQLHHFYSVTAEEAGINNELATVSIFAEAYDNVAPYSFLDKVICQWRRKEYDVRIACGLNPIESNYPGCFPLQRRERDRNLRRHDQQPRSQKFPDGTDFRTAHDIILYNDKHRNNPNHTNVRLHMEESNWGPAEAKDWDVWIEEQSKKMSGDEDLYHTMREKHHGGNHTEELHHQFRKLFQYEELEWFNYWPMLGVRTEYYFRYSGSQTIPPCYGNFVEESRVGTNHWRVMKDPIRIHTRQLTELRRLTAERIAPLGSPVDACLPDTAAEVTRDDVDSTKIVDVNNARPLQSWVKPHFKTFCECKDWPSKWPEDQKWCEIEDIEERFYSKPYNFGW
eukprot:CAMPEP_0168185640 /NCGR_PEP_ID=MMETSP0139_2-20121125/13962_1 /TAXON_ID=44445 /ORGANISM="Pseudo-nitzschia australis, Strain 10249 10 AB" /LENGTH=575 /DNA_ID=CAMNT_0008107505 /DNA_START=218 /DNA_END=1942 /DNA_ORIENTATION=-